ncbi:MAG: hypothetical protein DPW18_03530 [Chloroflexi bacterium]|nr:hypothetical protein [Chloroflexota bacterium]MDL1943147.1 hypothetical protein [Chloroflexi bacterium CFX2]
MLIDTLRYELPPEGITLLGYIVRRMHKTEWLVQAANMLEAHETVNALEAVAMYAVASATSFGRAYYQPNFNNLGEAVSERDPVTGANVTAKLISRSPAYRIAYSAEMNNGDIFEGAETILGTTIGLRGLGMPAPSTFTFRSKAYAAELKGTLTSELALSLFGNTKIRGYGSLDFSDSASNKGHLDLNRQGYVTLRINDKPAVTHALVRVMWLDDSKLAPQTA